jgi:hypothetical protein
MIDVRIVGRRFIREPRAAGVANLVDGRVQAVAG